jgi:hypothetical protein
MRALAMRSARRLSGGNDLLRRSRNPCIASTGALARCARVRFGGRPSRDPACQASQFRVDVRPWVDDPTLQPDRADAPMECGHVTSLSLGQDEAMPVLEQDRPFEVSPDQRRSLSGSAVPVWHTDRTPRGRVIDPQGVNRVGGQTSRARWAKAEAWRRSKCEISRLVVSDPHRDYGHCRGQARTRQTTQSVGYKRDYTSSWPRAKTSWQPAQGACFTPVAARVQLPAVRRRLPDLTASLVSGPSVISRS